MAEQPRALTKEEIRRKFLQHIARISKFWADLESEKNGQPISVQERLDGLAFSILVTLDGGELLFPGFVLAPNPHPEDMDYHKEHGTNWFPPITDIGDLTDIGGHLHDEYYKHEQLRDLANSNVVILTDGDPLDLDNS